MAQENNQISAEEIASAAWKGAKKAVNDKVAEPLSKLISPGDMNPEHMPHPLDDLTAKLSSLPNRLAVATEPRDMKIANVPHPVDATLAAVSEKAETIKAAGSVKGTELAAEMAVGAIIDRANPGKNLEVADDVLDAATDAANVADKVRRVEGHLVDEGAIGKGLAVSNEVEPSKTGLAKIKEQVAGIKDKAMDMVKHVPVVGDIVNPDFETRVAVQRHNLRPSLDDSLRARHLGNPGDIENAQKAISESAEDLIKKAKENPELAQQWNEQLTGKQIRDGIVKNTENSNLLTHGASSAGNYTPDVPPPSIKDFLPMSARDAAHLVFLPQNPSPERIARYTELLGAEYASHATKVQMAGVPYAWASLGGGAAVAANYVASSVGGEEKNNAELSKAFQDAVAKNNDKAMQQLGHDNPELKGAALYYQSAKNGLKVDGKLSTDESAALTKVADNVADKIKSEGPQYFDKPPQSLMREEAAPAATMQHDSGR